MTSRATTVDEYVAGVRAQWSTVVTTLRDMCRELLTSCDESIRYAMPCYLWDDRPVIAFAVQAQYLSFYVSQLGVLDGFRDQLEGLSVGKGCVRFRRPGDLRWDVIAAILAAADASDEEPC